MNTAVYNEQRVKTVVVDASRVQIVETLGETIELTQRVVEVVSAGVQGPAGPAGAPGTGGSSSVTYTAGEALGGHRGVLVDTGVAYYADSSVVADIGKLVGITTGAVSMGADAVVLTSGEITEPSWTWVPGPVYLGLTGLLTQTPPATGFIQVVGIAMTATVLLVRIQDPVLRG